MSEQTLQQQVDGYTWFHSMDLGNGIVSKGAKSSAVLATEARQILDPLNIVGASVLDVGAWNGFFSFESKRRGAARVLATDSFTWESRVFRGRETFDLAASLLNQKVEALHVDPGELAREALGGFDIVLFLGVYYHRFDAQLALQRSAACADHVLVIETHQDGLDIERPAMIYYPGATLANDPTNWWGPNRRLTFELLREFGFEHIFYQDDLTYGSDRGIFHAFRTADSIRKFQNQSISLHPFDIQLALESAERAQRFDALQAEIDARRSEVLVLQAEIEALRRSTSWRLTAPIQVVVDRLRAAK